MASFQSKIGWKRLRKRENETIASFHPYPIRNRKIQKRSKKIQKLREHLYGFISSQNRLEITEKERR